MPRKGKGRTCADLRPETLSEILAGRSFLQIRNQCTPGRFPTFASHRNREVGRADFPFPVGPWKHVHIARFSLLISSSKKLIYRFANEPSHACPGLFAHLFESLFL